MEYRANMKALFIIVNTGYSDTVMEVARSAGATGATILKARGEGARHEVFMGMTVDSEKEIVLSLLDAETAEAVMVAIKEKAGRSTPAHSICFTMPVSRIVGMTQENLYQEEVEK